MDRRRLSGALRAFGETLLADLVASGAGQWGTDLVVNRAGESGESAADVDALRQIDRMRLRRSSLDVDLRRALERILAALDRPDTTRVAMLHITAPPSHDVIILLDETRKEVIGILPANSERPNSPDE